jgi:integral membrane protein (TIGR01906 family)
MKQHNLLIKSFSLIVMVLTPLVILMIAIRLLITPTFARIAYQMPGFPADPYGFTEEDRLRWSEPSISYLVNAEDISYLSSLTFENDAAPIFNERELSHMMDVKAVVTGMRVALAAGSLILLAISIFAERGGWKPELIRAFNRGGWAVIGLIAAILVFVALNFTSLFTWFHQIFFESGTWQFYTSDTLIRLFPMRFWQDTFIFVGLLSVVFGVVVILLTRKRQVGDVQYE